MTKITHFLVILVSTLFLLPGGVVAQDDFSPYGSESAGNNWPRGEIQVANDWRDRVKVTLWTHEHERIGDSWVLEAGESAFLAVDDNRINLFMLERALTLQNASVKLAADGQQALQILKAQPEDFDVVLMDIQMPVMDGLATTRAIRDDPKLAGLPVIALTAGALGEERESAIAAGMNDFLPKPLDLGRLMAVLSAIPRASALEETQQRGMDQSD